MCAGRRRRPCTSWSTKTQRQIKGYPRKHNWPTVGAQHAAPLRVRITPEAGDGQRIKMSGQRETEVRKRRRSVGDSRTPDRNRQCAKGTSRLSMLLVRRLAYNEKSRKMREGSHITGSIVPGSERARP